MPTAPHHSAADSTYAIRPATTGDLGWINTNDMGWRVHEHGGFHDPFSLDQAWAVLVAQDTTGQRLGWVYVVDSDDHLVLHLLYVDQQHRCRGVARALTEHVCAGYHGRIVLGAWDRDLVEVWVKLGFVYEPPAEGERPGELSGSLVRPALG